MKKLVFLTETFPPDLCGVADYVAQLASALSVDYEVHIVTRKGDVDTTLVSKQVIIHTVLEGNTYIFDAVHILQTIQPDIIDVQLAYSSASHLHQLNFFTLINSFILRYFSYSSKRCLTVHELSTYLSDHPSSLRSFYRTLRDYGQTRFFDYYFCVSPSSLNYFKHRENKIFLPHFSNIPTLRTHNRVYNHDLLYFGTLAQNKHIPKLFEVFKKLHQQNCNFRLHIVGGIVSNFENTFFALTQTLPQDSYTYHGRLCIHSLSSVLDQCSYALYPFSINDKNSSVLAMLTNLLVVIANCRTVPVYASYGNNFYCVPEFDSTKIKPILDKTLGTTTSYPHDREIMSTHLRIRKNIYNNYLV